MIKPALFPSMNTLRAVRALGQQLWLDNLSRSLLNDGELARLIAEDGICGVTTNPSIFHKAIADGRHYEADLATLRQRAIDPEARYEALVIPDVQRACELLLPTHRDSAGRAGYVSLEVSPFLAHDVEATVAAGLRLKQAVARDNLLIKVPATVAGRLALSKLIAHGVSVNVTLMFSLAHADAVAEAYVAGLHALCDRGGDPASVCSVASLFLSRVDTAVDARLAALGGHATALCGKSAVAMARLAYRRYRARFDGGSFDALRARGAQPQSMLWASTGTKNPAYSDLLYVEPLIGADTINTLPDATLAALRDHGQAAPTIEHDIAGAEQQLAAVQALGIDLTRLGEQLQQDGLKQFEDAFAALLALTA